jgi:hypothetical protein
MQGHHCTHIEGVLLILSGGGGSAGVFGRAVHDCALTAPAAGHVEGQVWLRAGDPHRGGGARQPHCLP